MITRLSPLLPGIVIFVGALCIAFGGIWAAVRQSNFNAELREKNDEITRLQRENADLIIGGDDAVVVSALYGSPVPPGTRLPLVISNLGTTTPVRDVIIEILDRASLTNVLTLQLGTVLPDEHLRRIDGQITAGDYAINIKTARGSFFERLTLRQRGDEINQSYYIRRTGSQDKLWVVGDDPAWHP